MLLRSVIFIFFNLFYFGGYAQNLLDSRTSSYFTNIYQLTNAEAKNIYSSKKWAVDTSYLHTLVTRYPTDSIFSGNLPSGHYLRAHIEKNELMLSITSIQSFNVEVLNNSADLQLKIFDGNGGVISHARVKIGSKRVRYDNKTKTYRLKKTNKEGLLEITHNGDIAFYNLDRYYNNSKFKRGSKKVLYGIPAKYVWRPVKFILYLPIDGVRSIARGYAQGTISRTGRFFSNMYKSIACLFDDYYCEGDDSYKFENRHKGYMAFDKPKYLPQDTVKLKAFIANKRGKPIKKDVEIVLKKSYRDEIKLDDLSPYNPGGYSYQFVLHDSLDLQLDDSYEVRIQKKKYKNYISEYFEYEEYELGKNQLILEVPNKNFYLGDTISLLVSGKDENELNLLDGRLEVFATVKSISAYFNNEVFVSDTIAYFEMPLEPNGKTKVQFNSAMLPNVNCLMSISVSMLTSDNERIEKNELLNYYFRKEEITYELDGDSIAFDYRVNGDIEKTTGQVWGQDGFDNKFDQIEVDFPYKTTVNPYYYVYGLRAEGIEKEVLIREEPSLLNIRTLRTSDTIFISTLNPRNIGVSYFLYKANDLIERGFNNDLDIKKRAKSNKSYHLSIQYLWGGKVIEENYEIPQRRDLLNVAIDAPPVIYPGQETNIEVTVTDYRGDPVPNTDVLVQGLTKKFNATPLQLPSLGKPAKDRELINTFSLDQRPYYQTELQFDYTRWNREFGLDSIAYFQFLFPEGDLYNYHTASKDSITQFSPFVIKNGLIEPVSVIHLDKQPVYFNWTAKQPYSFEADTGYHKLQLRTDDYEYTIDSVQFQYGHKHILSIDEDQLPSSVGKEKKRVGFSDYEKNNYQRYTLPYRNTFDGRFGYLSQGNRYFPFFSAEYRSLAGPISDNLVNFQLVNSYDHQFLKENGFEYEFRPGLIKMRTLDIKDRIYPRPVRVDQIHDEVWTQRKIEKRWSDELLKRRRNSRQYSNPLVTSPDKGSLMIHVDDRIREKMKISNTLLLQLDDAAFFRVYPSLNDHFNDLSNSLYRAILLHEDESYTLIDSIDVKVRGLNYLKIDSLLILPEDSFSMKANAQLDGYFSKQSFQPFGEREKEVLRRAYRQQYQYFGSGEVVSGFVMDEEGNGLPGVNVIVKGTTYGTITNIDGFYSLKVPDYGAELSFSFIGLAPENVSIGSRTSIDVSMEADVKQLSEVIVTGLGVTRTKQSMGYAVSDMTSTLSGRVSGVQITNASGSPGSVASISIRGASTINSNSEPLIVIDGVPFSGDFSSLNMDPDLIASISVLKDESATAIYGSRAANGVLIITTNPSGTIHTVAGETEKRSSDQSLLQSSSRENTIRNNFSDVAFWQPQLLTDDNGKAKFEVTFPDDITKWETFVYAANRKKQIGQSQGEIKAFKPISARLEMPRFLVVGDSAHIIGKSSNYTFDSISVKTSFEVDDSLVQSNHVSFKDALVDTLMIAPGSTDSINVQYTLSKEDGYFDGERREIAVYPEGITKKTGEYATLTSDTTVNWTFSPDQGPVHVYMNSDPISIVKDKIEYLKGYRYECNEQLASKLKALVISKDLDKSLESFTVRDRQVNRIIRKLTKNQNNDGFWGWWDNSRTEYWISVHVIESLVLARNQGFNVNLDYEKLTDEILWILSSYSSKKSRLEVLYMASLLGLEIRLEEYIEELDSTRDVMLAGQLRLLRVKQLNGMHVDLTSLADSLKTDNFGRSYLDNDELFSFASSSVRLSTMALDVLSNDSIMPQKVTESVANYLLSQLSDGSNLNTYTTANLIQVLSPILQGVDGLEQAEVELSGDISNRVLEFPYYQRFDNLENLMLSKIGGLPLYVNAYQESRVQTPVIDSSNFLIKTYFPEQQNDLTAGRPVKVFADVEIFHDAEYVMIEIPIPAGCSYNTKKNHFRGEVHREYYKEKVSIFCKKLNTGIHTFEVDLLPRYSGNFVLNPASIELMYFPVFSANEETKRIEIQ